MILINLIVLLLLATMSYAQAPPSALPTDPQQVQTLLQQTGCQYEVSTAAQTIANLQKQVNELQQKLAKDPPRKK